MTTERPTTDNELETQALAWPERASALAVTDQASHDRAAALVIEVVELRRRVQKHHAPIKEAAHKAHRAAVDAEKRLLDPLQRAEATLKKAIGAWEDWREHLRQEEQRKLEEAQHQADEEARIARAQEALEQDAPQERIEEILETPVVQRPAAVAPTYEKTKGVTRRVEWRAEVTDPQALCRAIGAGEAPAHFVQANLPVLNGLARSLKENFNVPGCRAVAETTVSVRR